MSISNIDRGSSNYERSRSREVRVTFNSKLKVELGSSASGLPQTNPPLEAKVEDNVLTWITSNAVSNTFRLKITARELGTRSSQK
jgi:hypothetical protein